MPPPPVPGAAVGNGDGLGDGDGLGLGVVSLGTTVPGVVGVPLGVVVLGVPLTETDGDTEPLAPGANEVGVVDGEPAVQADTDVTASMATAAQPRKAPRKRRRS